MLTLSDHKKKKLSQEAIDAIKGNRWEKTAKKWEEVLDMIPVKDRDHTWEAPAEFLEIPYREIAQIQGVNELSNEDFITKLYSDILHRVPDQKGMTDWLKALSHGMPRQQVLSHFVTVSNNHNTLEARRTGLKMQDDKELRIFQL